MCVKYSPSNIIFKKLFFFAKMRYDRYFTLKSSQVYINKYYTHTSFARNKKNVKKSRTRRVVKFTFFKT